MPERSGPPTDIALFRCDGGVEVGLGHVSRSLALAEALSEEGVAALFVGEFSEQARGLLESAGMEFRAPGGPVGSEADLAALSQLAAERRALGFIVDSYAVGASFLASLSARAPLAVLDDFAALGEYDCAAVLNMTVSGVSSTYPTGRATLLLGPEYLLARRAVRRLGRKPAPSARAERALVALGGVDRHGLTARVLGALAEVGSSLQVRVVLRPGDGALGSVQTALTRFASAEVLSGLDSLASLYAWADVCVGGGGLMKYETALVGLPTGVLAQTEGEARDVVRCAERGFVLELGGPDEQSRPRALDLARLIQDGEVRTRLYAASAALFGGDPALRAARAVLGALRDERTSRRGAS